MCSYVTDRKALGASRRRGQDVCAPAECGNTEVGSGESNPDAASNASFTVPSANCSLHSRARHKPVAGHFNAPGRLGIDIRFARHTPGKDGGDFPFTVIDLKLNADGEGQGRMSIATKVIVNKEKNMITLENLDLQPVLLTQVKRVRSH